jgi:hypothetical protein
LGAARIRVRELGSGRSRLETARTLGIDFQIAANMPIEAEPCGDDAPAKVLVRRDEDEGRAGGVRKERPGEIKTV